MIQISGKILVFTDLHLGLKNASKSRLAICVNVIKHIISYIKQHDIKTCLFLGDWHHSRVSTENNVLNVSFKLMSALAKYCKVYVILGNHDIYMKNSVEINSLVCFNAIENVTLIDKVTEVDINGFKSLLVPWLGDVSTYETMSIDFMFGHFDVAHKYLIKSYIEDHAEKYVSENTKQMINNDPMLQSNVVQQSAGDFIGDFVDAVKKTGTIFSGHIHGRREFLAKGRKFVFVGDPYQQNLGEKDFKCGFYILNEDGSHEFSEIVDVPHHVELRMSEVAANVDTFDFSIVSGNIVHKVYDVEVEPTIDAKITQKINDRKPYEELLPDYEVGFNSCSDIKMQNESIELIKKSKLDYVHNYIQNIDEEVLKEQNIQSEKLFAILKEYYTTVIDEK